MRSILKALIIVIVGTVAFGLCLVYFGGIIEQVIEILRHMLGALYTYISTLKKTTYLK